MRAAAIAGDAETFNEHVDYPKLRESLKGQLSAAMASRLGSDVTAGNEMAKAGSAFGAMLGMAMVDKMVDAFVRPETVMRAMQEGKMAPQADRSKPVGDSTSDASKPGVTWNLERRGVSRTIAYAQETGKANANQVGLVFDRIGFADWKLTGIYLPEFK